MKIKYMLTDDNGTTEIFPQVGKEATITWNDENELRFDYKQEIKELVFIGSAYKQFLAIELSEGRCDQQLIEIFSICGNAPDNLLYAGSFTMSQGQWDLDLCMVKFKVKEVDEYTCIEENSEDQNILALTLPKYSVDLNLSVGTEFLLCCYSGCSDLCDDQYLKDELFSFQKELTLFEASLRDHVRLTLDVDCAYALPDGWIEVAECADGKKRIATSMSAGRDYPIPTGRNTIFGIHHQFEEAIVDNGLNLYNVLNALLLGACGLPHTFIVSDFFQWNPENPGTVNYVTGEENKWDNLIIFQKSDFKRPNAVNNATKGETNFLELLELVCEMFNCRYKKIDNILRIEHLSWFDNNVGIDLVASDKRGLLSGSRKYNYDAKKLPKYERFEFMESGSPDFKGEPIIYENDCVNNDEENKKTVNIDKITTDVLHVLANSSSESELVSDDGFVLVACDADYIIRSEEGILENNGTPNNVLGWSYLHEKLFKHGRVLRTGNMNGVTTSFETVVPTIKQKKFSAILSCDQINDFEPTDLMRGTLGWGKVVSAELHLSQCKMGIELALDEIDIAGTGAMTKFGDFDDNFDDNFD